MNIFDNERIDISGFRHLYPFQPHYLDVNGQRCHYLDEGRGEPVVMVHGNPTWSFYFRKLVRGLSHDYRALAMDHIGCGLSSKPLEDEYGFRLKDRIDDLEALLAQVVPEQPVTLVVHDWGGAIGMGWAVRHPERVRRLVITNTAGFFPPEGKPIPLRLRIVRNMTRLARPLVLRLNAFSAGAARMAAAKPLARDVRTGLTAPYNTPRNRLATLKFVQDIPLDPGDPSYDEVARIEKNLGLFNDLPILILWGERDFVFDTDYFAEWKRRFPKAIAHGFPNAGHYLFEDEPRATLDLVLNFLKDTAVEDPQ